MSWNNCKKCVFVHRSAFTSALFKVLLTLKLLHGSRSGARGSTLEDIAMHMIKHFCLDGDIKSQVLASLKYGVKMHFIQKRKEKFSLILPASSIHLAPCKFKNEETERIQCIFPSTWYSNVCNDVCSGEANSCCGKRKRTHPNVCCQKEEEEEESPCALCKKKKQPQQQICSQQQVCSQPQPCSQPPPCPRPKPPPCPRPCPKPRNYSKPCEESSSSSANSKTSVSSSDDPCSPCYPQPKKPKKTCPKTSCRTIQQPVCARRKSRSSCPKSPYDDYCQMCPQVHEEEDDDDDNQFATSASVNCSCCNK